MKKKKDSSEEFIEVMDGKVMKIKDPKILKEAKKTMKTFKEAFKDKDKIFKIVSTLIDSINKISKEEPRAVLFQLVLNTLVSKVHLSDTLLNGILTNQIFLKNMRGYVTAGMTKEAIEFDIARRKDEEERPQLAG